MLVYIGAKTKREVEAELSGSLYGKYRSQIKESDFNRVDGFNQLLHRLTLILYMNDNTPEAVTYNFYGFDTFRGPRSRQEQWAPRAKD